MKELIRILKFTFFSLSAGIIELGVFALLRQAGKDVAGSRYVELK